MSVSHDKYSLSFTAVSFRLHDFLRVANYLQENNKKPALTELDPEAILNKGNKKTSKRELQEFLKRYKCLSIPQRSILFDGTLDEQKKITFLSIIKSNSFIRDFVLEVVRDKSLIFDFIISDADFISFVNRKSELHPELEGFADSTISKARQTIFKILVDAGLIDNTKSKTIIQQWLSPRVVKVTAEDNPEWLKAFLLSDSDIKLTLNK